MAKRLTKALREKRRWVGVLVQPGITTREKAAQAVEDLRIHLDLASLKLMDFRPASERETDDLTGDIAGTHHDGGLAVLKVRLSDVMDLRRCIEGEKAFEQHGMRGLTTSGKIRLVRQRLGLPKPNRHR